LGNADDPGHGPPEVGRQTRARSLGAEGALRGAGEVVRGAVPRLRRSLPLIVSLVALAWIITVIVLITLHPVAGTGNPMD
jgi:hypothetical protein